MSSDLERVLRDLAELDETARVEEVLAIPTPDRGVSYGRTTAGAAPSLAEVLRAPQFLAISEQGAASATESLPFQLFRDSRLPQVIALEALEATPTAQYGEVQLDAHGAVMSGLRGPSAVVIAEPSGDVIVGVDAGGMRIQRVRRAPPALEVQWAPRHLALPAEPPTVDELLAGYACEGWLPAAARTLAASPSPLTRVAGIGMVARLWSPATSAERSGLLAQRHPDPNRRALDWFGTLHEETRAQVLDIAIAEAVAWREDLEGLALVEDDADAKALSLDLLTRRDVLESAAFLLGAAATPLRTELRSLDEEAELHLSAFVPLDPDPVLADWMSAVGAWDPLAWWSAAGA